LAVSALLLLIIVKYRFYMAIEGLEHSTIVCLMVVVMPARILTPRDRTSVFSYDNSQAIPYKSTL